MIIGSVGTLFLGGCFLWALFGSPLFKITQVKIEGVEFFSEQEVIEKTWGYLHDRRFLFFTNENRLLFHKDTCQEHLESFYAFEYLNLDIVDGETLHLSFKEKASELLWTSSEMTYVVDLHGMAIREISHQESSWLEGVAEEEIMLDQRQFLSLPRFRDLNDIEVVIGENVLTENEIEAIFRFQQHLDSQQIAFTETQIDRLSGKWMGVLTIDQYLILFDAYGNIDDQAGHLETVLRDSVQSREDLEYIDVRFGDHVYFK